MKVSLSNKKSDPIFEVSNQELAEEFCQSNYVNDVKAGVPINRCLSVQLAEKYWFGVDGKTQRDFENIKRRIIDILWPLKSINPPA